MLKWQHTMAIKLKSMNPHLFSSSLSVEFLFELIYFVIIKILIITKIMSSRWDLFCLYADIDKYIKEEYICQYQNKKGEYKKIKILYVFKLNWRRECCPKY